MPKRNDLSELKPSHLYPAAYDNTTKEEALRVLFANNLNFNKTRRDTGIALNTLRGFLNAHVLALKAKDRMIKIAECDDETIEQKKVKYERAAWDAKMIIIENIVAVASPSADVAKLAQALRAIHWTTMEPMPDPGDGQGGNNSEANILSIVTNQILQIKQNINPNGTKNNRAVRNRKKPPRQSGG